MTTYWTIQCPECGRNILYWQFSAHRQKELVVDCVRLAYLVTCPFTGLSRKETCLLFIHCPFESCPAGGV